MEYISISHNKILNVDYAIFLEKTKNEGNTLFLNPGMYVCVYTGSSKKMDGIWNRYNLKSTRRIYTFGILKCSENFKDLDLS